VQVYDMPTAVKFYRENWGLSGEHVAGDGAGKFHWCLLRLGGAEIMLNTAYEFDKRAAGAGGSSARRTAWRHGFVLRLPDVDGAYEELRDKGVAVKPPKVAPYGMKQMPVQDPDGYGCASSGGRRTDVSITTEDTEEAQSKTFEVCAGFDGAGAEAAVSNPEVSELRQRIKKKLAVNCARLL